MTPTGPAHTDTEDGSAAGTHLGLVADHIQPTLALYTPEITPAMTPAITPSVTRRMSKQWSTAAQASRRPTARGPTALRQSSVHVWRRLGRARNVYDKQRSAESPPTP